MGFWSDLNPSNWSGSSNNSWTDKLEKSLLTGGVSDLASLESDWDRVNGGGPGPSTSASDTFARLTRDRWAEYVKTFVPIENQLIDYATNPNTVKDAMSNASTNVNAAFDAQQGAVGRRLEGLGLNLNADEQKSSDLSQSLNRGLADVQGQNLARDATVSRQQQILGNPAPDVVRAGTTGMGG